ncbi:hypothetical protein Bbelb_064950 [Branchiostoma belcheri]|nr:hypothetical protein Bbelb_064950 [Branchiostoma belcheri]
MFNVCKAWLSPNTGPPGHKTGYMGRTRTREHLVLSRSRYRLRHMTPPHSFMFRNDDQKDSSKQAPHLAGLCLSDSAGIDETSVRPPAKILNLKVTYQESNLQEKDSLIREKADAGLKTFENACTDHSSSGATGAETFFLSQGESGAHRLVRVCKAFSHTGACEKSGHPKEFEAFLQPCVPAKVNKLISFRGERFNVLFKNGGATYHHKDDLLAYLDTCEAPNRLLQAVRADLRVPVYVAGCCALGIINKIVTAPLWRLVESESSILDMCQHFHQLHISFKSFIKDHNL